MKAKPMSNIQDTYKAITGVRMQAVLTDRHTTDNYSLEWDIFLNDTVCVQYSEGIGHFLASSFNRRYTDEFTQDIHRALTLGVGAMTNRNRLECADFTKRVKVHNSNGYHKIPKTVTPPDIKDVLYSLTMDADAVNHGFQDWCCNYGLDDDSIKAQKMYEACRDNFTKLRQLGLDFDALQAYYEDY